MTLPQSHSDKEGFLLELSEWSPSVAQQIATTEGIVLSPEHWEVVHLLRTYYAEFDSSPAMRALVKREAGEGIWMVSRSGESSGSPATWRVVGRSGHTL